MAQVKGSLSRGAIISLFSDTGLGLKCYCDDFMNGVKVFPPRAECAPNNTCVITDASTGQCFYEHTLIEEGYLEKYGCYEILSPDISVSAALYSLCNGTHGTAPSTQCCVYANYCNENIRFTTTSTASAVSNSPTDYTGKQVIAHTYL